MRLRPSHDIEEAHTGAMAALSVLFLCEKWEPAEPLRWNLQTVPWPIVRIRAQRSYCRHHGQCSQAMEWEEFKGRIRKAVAETTPTDIEPSPDDASLNQGT